MKYIIYTSILVLLFITTHVALKGDYFSFSINFPTKPIQIIIDTDKSLKFKESKDENENSDKLNDEYTNFDNYQNDSSHKNQRNNISSEQKPNLFKVITAKTALNARANSSTNAKILFKIPKGSIIEVLEEKGKTSAINIFGKRVKGAWVKVSYLDRTAYVFDYYLSKYN